MPDSIALPRPLRHRLTIAAMLLAAAGAILTRDLPAAQDFTFSTGEELRADVARVPCESSRRMTEAKELFRRMGAAESEISIDRYKGVENVTVRKQGDGPGVIVLGAHYDKAWQGCGALDNWSGVVTLAHVYKTLGPFKSHKTLLFVLFGMEEEGLKGSKAMVQAMDADQISNVCAMINLDSIGMGAPQVAENISNKSLRLRAQGLAQAMKIPFGHARVPGNSDSSSFLDRGVPALTIHAVTSDFREILHTSKDQVSAVKPESLYLTYRLVLTLLESLDTSDCAIWRESKTGR